MAALKLTFSTLLSEMESAKKTSGYINTNGGFTTNALKGGEGSVSLSGTTLTLQVKGDHALKASALSIAETESVAKGTWNVTGTAKADYFVISDNVNDGTIKGGAGNDTFAITGGEKLVVDGGAGADVFLITAGHGTVSLYGGLGADTFNFASAGSSVKAVFAAGGYNPDEDMIVGIGGTTTTGALTSATDASAASTLISSSGVVSLASGVTVALEKTYNNTDYYKAKIQGQTVYAGSGTGTVINGSAENNSVVLIGNNNEENDLVRGGNGADTIFAGVGDSVLGGRGNDTFTIDPNKNTGISIGFSETAKAGNDQVNNVNLNAGNTFTDEATSFYLGNGSLGKQFKGVSFNANGANNTGTMTLKGQDGTLQLNGVGDQEFLNVTMLDAGGRYNTTFFQDTLASVSEKNADIYYSAASKGTLEFSGITTDLVVDLSNSRGLEDTATYYNVSRVVAGNGNNVVMVGGTGSTTLQASGGQTSMWGGSADNDSLIGGSGRDYFALSAKGGKDTVENFTTGRDTFSDAVYLLGTGLASVKKNSSNAMTFTGVDGSSLVMKNVVGGADDDVIGYSTNGVDVTYGKVGTSGTKSTFTYEGDVVAYVGGKAGSTLNAATAGDVTVWLDGNAGVGYQNIGVVDASGNAGNAVLGGTAANETLVGGSGASTLWGAAGNDSLVGGSGANTFVVGAGEGTSTIVNGKTSDVVMLYNVASTGVSGSTVKNGNMTVSFRNGGSFTVNDYVNGPSTFNTTDGTFTVNADGGIDFAKNA